MRMFTRRAEAVSLLSRAQTRVQFEGNCLFSLVLLKKKHGKERRREEARTGKVPFAGGQCLSFDRSLLSLRRQITRSLPAPNSCVRLLLSPLCMSQSRRCPELTWALLLRPGAPPSGAPEAKPPGAPPPLPLAALRPRPPRGLRARFLSPPPAPLEAAGGPSTMDANATALGRKMVLLREKRTEGE